MPKRRAKWSTKKRPLDFAESPLNGRHDLPTPVHCSLYPPVTADIVPVEQIASSWVSPQFEGKLLQGETIRHRVRRLPPGGHRRAPSVDSSSIHGRFTDAEQGTRPRHRRHPTFRPLKFILNESSEVTRKCSDDESTTSDGECDRLAERALDAHERRRRSAPQQRSQEENGEADGDQSIGNSFADIMLIGKHLHVQTPEDSQAKNDLPPNETDHKTTSPSLAEEGTSKRNLSRRLFRETTNEMDCGEILTGAEERLPSSENVSERAVLETNTQVALPRANDISFSHLSFESKDDSMFVGCLPRVNLLDGSMFLRQNCSLSLDETLDISKIETVLPEKSPEPPTAVAKTTVPVCEPLLRLPCQVLSSITMETPPQLAKDLNILVKETPVSYHGLTYRQKQLKGFL